MQPTKFREQATEESPFTFKSCYNLYSYKKVETRKLLFEATSWHQQNAGAASEALTLANEGS